MTNVSIEEVQARLPEILDTMAPGQELIVTRDSQPVAMLARTPRTSWPCQAGSASNQILWIAPDFDEPLEEFREYME